MTENSFYIVLAKEPALDSPENWDRAFNSDADALTAINEYVSGVLPEVSGHDPITTYPTSETLVIHIEYTNDVWFTITQVDIAELTS